MMSSGSLLNAARNKEPSDDTNKQLYKFMNMVVLQYLDTLGFRHTACSFIQECQDEGHPVPQRSAQIEKSLRSMGDSDGLRHKDVELLMRLYDDLAGEGLLEMWNNVIVKVVKEKHSDFFKVHVHLHIYVFITIPEAKKYSNREKSESIQHFIDEFKNHEVNDPEVLSLFAMPWVSNPTSHPVFSKYYAEKWVDSLRKNLRAFCMSLCKPLPDPFDADLAKMSRVWFNLEDFMFQFNFAQYGKLGNSADELSIMTADVQQKTVPKLPENSYFKAFFDEVLCMRADNDVVRQEDRTLKVQYMQKIQLCDALVTCLKELYNNSDNGHIPWERIMETCSQMTFLDSVASDATLKEESSEVQLQEVKIEGRESIAEASVSPKLPPISASVKDLPYENKPTTSRIASSRQPNPTADRPFWRENPLTQKSSPRPMMRRPDVEQDQKLEVIHPRKSSRPTHRTGTGRPAVKSRTCRKGKPESRNGCAQLYGDGDWQACPPPPEEFGAGKCSSSSLMKHSPRSLLSMMQASNMLREIVRESATINENEQ